MKPFEKTIKVKVAQWVGGRGAGKHGIQCYDYEDKGMPSGTSSEMYGLCLHKVVGLGLDKLGEGSELEVTVRVVKRRAGRINPWWTHDQRVAANYRRREARKKAARAGKKLA